MTAAAAGAAKTMPADFRVSITNAPGKDAYPIASFTWLLIPDHIRGRTKRKAMVGFLNWMLTDGQKDWRRSVMRRCRRKWSRRAEADRANSTNMAAPATAYASPGAQFDGATGDEIARLVTLAFGAT